MDIIALTNTSGYIRAGDPRNVRQQKYDRPLHSGIQEDSAVSPYILGLSTPNMKTNSGSGLSGDEKSMIFSEILRAAYDRKLGSNA